MQKNPTGDNGLALTQQELDALLLAHERYSAGRGGQRAQLAHAVLDSLNLANRQLTEAEFAGASLASANFYGSDLERASLYCADLRGADLRFATLTRTDLRGATLKGATLAHAVLDGADLRAATMLMYREGEGMSVLDRFAAGATPREPRGVDFSGCSLKNTTFSKALLEGTNFAGALLQGARFKGARMTNPCFHGAVLTGVNLSEFDLPAHALDGAVLDISHEAAARTGALKAALARHQDWVVSSGKEGEQAKFPGEDLRPLEGNLSNRVLSTLEMPGCCAVGVDFSGSHLQAAKFDGADLRDANFTGADLRGASFRGARLAHARLDHINLGNLVMADGRVIKPDFAGADASFAQFMTATLDNSLASLGLDAAD